MFFFVVYLYYEINVVYEEYYLKLVNNVEEIGNENESMWMYFIYMYDCYVCVCGVRCVFSYEIYGLIKVV